MEGLIINVQEASNITGLTKKAIKFYEDKGLIVVLKNPLNNYREYSKENIVQLNLIASLRVIGLSIESIKVFIDGKKSLSVVLNEQYDLIDNQLKKLSEKKLLTKTLINTISETEEFVDMVSVFEKTLNLNAIEKTEFVSDQLRRVFPGVFGEFIAIVFEPFLEFKIESEKKKMAWLEFVAYLDDMNDIPDFHPVMQLINLDLKDKIEAFKSENKTFIFNLLEGDKTTFDTQVAQIVQLVRNVKDDSAFRENFISQTKIAADIPSFKDGTKFSDLLNEISPVYSKFLYEQRKVKAAADKQLGLDSQEYLLKVVDESS